MSAEPTLTRPSFARDWLPVLAWMALIFAASGDWLSSSHTSRLLGPLLRWWFSGLSEQAIDVVLFAVRKAGHLGEYAVLGWLCWRALRQPQRADARAQDSRAARLAVLICALYAVTDELHQSFTASRTPSAWDVMLDTLGATAGLALAWWLRSRLSRRRGRGA
jgi:VanZ family protein